MSIFTFVSVLTVSKFVLKANCLSHDEKSFIGAVNVASKTEHKYNHEIKTILMGFDTIEINLVTLLNTLNWLKISLMPSLSSRIEGMLVLIHSYYGVQSVGTRLVGGVMIPWSTKFLMLREYYTM